uniref:Putative secreted protein n=1 Tax=Anopheles darlingi TaxID=43151 RepID=A0A2M4DDX7_ANODA
MRVMRVIRITPAKAIGASGATVLVPAVVRAARSVVAVDAMRTSVAHQVVAMVAGSIRIVATIRNRIHRHRHHTIIATLVGCYQKAVHRHRAHAVRPTSHRCHHLPHRYRHHREASRSN